MGKDADFESVKRMAKDSADALKDRLGNMDLPDVDALKAAAGELAEDAAGFVRKYPLHSLLGALAAGFLLGSVLSRRK